MYFAKFVAKSRENHHGLREVDREKSRSWSRKVAKSRNVFAKLAINREFSRSDEKLCEKPSWGVLVSRCLLFSLREVGREKSRCFAKSSRKVAKFFSYFAKSVAKSRDVLRCPREKSRSFFHASQSRSRKVAMFCDVLANSRDIFFILRKVGREKSRCFAMSSRNVATFFSFFTKSVAKSRDVLRCPREESRHFFLASRSWSQKVAKFFLTSRSRSRKAAKFFPTSRC